MESLFERAVDRCYWQTLNPRLSIQADIASSGMEARPLDRKSLAELLNKLEREGYFQAEPILVNSQIGRMRDCVEKLRAEQWPPVWSFVYDQFWASVRTPSLLRLLGGFLGDHCRQNCNIWTHYVASSEGAHGWAPHTDSNDGRSRLTIWIPLTDATVNNGCIYLIPQNRMAASLPGSRKHRSVTMDQLGSLLQGVKALPAKAGSLLGWNHQVVHWGSVSSGHAMPRVSIAFEFIAAGTDAAPSELPLFDLLRLPNFAERLSVIGRAILKYKKFEALPMRFLRLADRLKRTSLS